MNDLHDIALIAGGAALVVTLTATPLVRRLAVSLDLYDRPDGGLKPHQRPIPYLGGAAMLCGWLAALIWTGVSERCDRSELAWIVAGGAVLSVTGLIDDLRHLPPRLRLLIQFLVAAGLLYGGIGRGVAAQFIEAFGAAESSSSAIGWWGYPLSGGFCLLLIASACNATNLIDGMDGLCAGVLGLAGIGFLAICLLLSPSGTTDGEGLRLVAALAAAQAGACLAFLAFNFNPASIFMGDSGSLLLGYGAATAMILLADRVGPQAWLAAMLVFGFPIFDASLTVVRRAINRRPLFVGDRSHFYDQLRDRGLSVRRTVVICYSLGLVCLGLGLTALQMTLPGALLLAAGAVAAAGAVSRVMGLFRTG